MTAKGEDQWCKHCRKRVYVHSYDRICPNCGGGTKPENEMTWKEYMEETTK